MYLAQERFYDGTTFHRIVTDFVDQGGDPNGNGTGGPGYTAARRAAGQRLQAGSVAMANAGAGTTGSQFFLVVSDSGASSSARPALQVLVAGRWTPPA